MVDFIQLLQAELYGSQDREREISSGKKMIALPIKRWREIVLIGEEFFDKHSIFLTVI